MLTRIFTILFLLTNSINTFSQTEASGNQSGTWTTDSAPYPVVGEIIVPPDQTLHIEAGVVISFEGHYKFTVNGTLLAMGTESDSIFFTTDDPVMGWHGVRLTELQSGSSLIYCRIEYGKTSGSNFPDQHGGGIMLHGSNAIVDHCTFANNDASADDNGMGGAIYGINTSGQTQITNCSFINNRICLWGNNNCC